MSWLLFALLTPFLNAIDSLGEKFLVDKQVEHFVVIIFNEGILYLIFSLFIFFFHPIAVLSFVQIGALLLAGALFVFYLIPYFKALEKEDSSRVIPFFQLIPVMVLILSAIFLREVITGKELLAFVVILIGSILLSLEKDEKKLFKPRKALWFMLLSCLLYALTPILFKFVVVQTDFWSAFFYEALGAAIGTFLLLLYPTYRKSFFTEGLHMPFPTRGLMSVSQLLAIGAEVSSSFAFSLAPVALVNVFTGLQPVFVFGFGTIISIWFPHILKEDLDKTTLWIKGFSLLLILSGIVLLTA